MAEFDGTPTEGAPTGEPASAPVSQDPSTPSTQPTTEGAWPKEVQAAYTKKTQALAEERKAFEAKQKDWETQRENAVKQLQSYYQQIQQQRGQGQQQAQPDILDQLPNMDYVDGRTAAQLAQRLQQGINPLTKSYQQLQSQNQWLYQELGKVQKAMQEIQGGKRESDFNSLITRTRAELGLPDSDVVTEAIKDVYLSHQDDDDLRENFPSLVRDRMENLKKVFFEAAKTQASQARKLPFSGAGGTVAPTGGADRGRMTVEQIADMLYQPNPEMAE